MSDKNLVLLVFNLIFPDLIENTSNFEINRLIRLVVCGMFQLLYSDSLMTFSSFQSHF